MDKSRSPSLAGLVFTVVIVVAVLIYALVALNTQDHLWFVSTFSERPNQIVINCYGEQLILREGSPYFDGLVELINAVLSGRKYWDSTTLSEETYQEYQKSSNMMVIELFYAPRVRIHSFYKYFSNLDSIVIPLDGRHANTNAIFGRVNDLSTAGALHFEGIPDIREYIEEQAICVGP